MSKTVDLVKQVRGLNTYKKAINSSFTELIPPPVVSNTPQTITVQQFFDYYNQIFYTIPAKGLNESHEYLVKTSQEYIGGAVLDSEKQALIEEINTLRQQILDLSNTYININKLI
jgi:hypothetical protein